MLRNLSNIDLWLRCFYVLFFLLCAKLAMFLVLCLSVLQIVFVLFTGDKNNTIRVFGGQLAQFVGVLVEFVMGKSDKKPFPFNDWPDA